MVAAPPVVEEAPPVVEEEEVPVVVTLALEPEVITEAPVRVILIK